MSNEDLKYVAHGIKKALLTKESFVMPKMSFADLGRVLSIIKAGT